MSRIKKQKFKLPFKPLAWLLIILLVSFFILGYIWKVLTSADFFSVKQILVRDAVYQLDYLKGRNIFKLDLNSEARRIYIKCPDCRRVRLTRVLPNTLVADFLKRKPLALAKFYKDFAVDEQGVLFVPQPSAALDELPVIYGLETKIFAPRAGMSYRNSAIGIALSIIKEFKANRAFRGFALTRIYVAGTASVGFFMLGPQAGNTLGRGRAGAGQAEIEVRIGFSSIRQKMIILGGLLQQELKEWNNIKYIDLRFKEPLIKLNNAK